MIQPSFAFMKRAPSSASAAEYAINFMMLQGVYIAPFRRMGTVTVYIPVAIALLKCMGVG